MKKTPVGWNAGTDSQFGESHDGSVPGSGTPIEASRARDMQRLDGMFRALQPAMLRGEERVVATCLKILEARARIRHLDASSRPDPPEPPYVNPCADWSTENLLEAQTWFITGVYPGFPKTTG